MGFFFVPEFRIQGHCCQQTHPGSVAFRSGKGLSMCLKDSQAHGLALRNPEGSKSNYPGRELFHIRRSATDSYQHMGSTRRSFSRIFSWREVTSRGAATEGRPGREPRLGRREKNQAPEGRQAVSPRISSGHQVLFCRPSGARRELGLPVPGADAPRYSLSPLRGSAFREAVLDTSDPRFRNRGSDRWIPVGHSLPPRLSAPRGLPHNHPN